MTWFYNLLSALLKVYEHKLFQNPSKNKRNSKSFLFSSKEKPPVVQLPRQHNLNKYCTYSNLKVLGVKLLFNVVLARVSLEDKYQKN